MKCVIMRGLPGGGKSTLAQKMFNDYGHTNGGKVADLYAGDDFWYVDGEYRFDHHRLTEAHHWNQDRAIVAFENQYDLVIIDNTNIQFWEMLPYIIPALANGYEIEFVEADTIWRFNVDKLLKMNRHGLPENILQGMHDAWEDTTAIIKKCELVFRCNSSGNVIYYD